MKTKFHYLKYEISIKRFTSAELVDYIRREAVSSNVMGFPEQMTSSMKRKAEEVSVLLDLSFT
jgi:hypothetical protein